MFLDCLKVLYSLVLLPCVPEIISKLPFLELKFYISSLKEVLRMKDSVYHEKIIRDFFKRVSQLRKDAAPLVEEELSGAKHDGDDPIWRPELMQNPLDLIVQPHILHQQVKYCVEKAVRCGIWLELYEHLTILRHSSNTYNRLILKAFEEELLACPERLGPKQRQSMTEQMLRFCKYELMVRPYILAFMGHLVELYPSMMKKVKIELSRLMLECMDKLDYERNVEAMKSLLVFLQLFKGRKHQDFFNEILRTTVHFLNDEDPKYKLYALKIFCEIARRSRSFPRSPITEIAESQLPNLLVYLHSCDPEISMSAAVCIKHCLPHVGCRNLLDQTRRTMQMAPISTHIQDVYTQLQRSGLLERVLYMTIRKMDDIEDGEALLKHICFLREMIPYSQLSPLDLHRLWKSLKIGVDGNKSGNTNIAESAVKALGEKWKSLGTVFPAVPYRPGEILW